MKNHHCPPPLHPHNLLPYMNGCNVLRYTNSNGDIFIGEIRKITPRMRNYSNIISDLEITLIWICRVRDAINVGTLGESREWQIIDGTYLENYDLAFEHPQLEKVRSPLIIRSKQEVIEISHVTEIAQLILKLKPELPRPHVQSR